MTLLEQIKILTGESNEILLDILIDKTKELKLWIENLL